MAMSSSDTDQSLNDLAPDKRRASQRRRILKAGIIAFNDRHSTLPCTVRNVSDTGALIRMPGGLSPPDTFDLIIELDGLEASCTVMWRKGEDVGVHFNEPPRRIAPRRSQVVTAVVPAKTPTLRRKPR
jgi:hypothetical protein